MGDPLGRLTLALGLAAALLAAAGHAPAAAQQLPDLFTPPPATPLPEIGRTRSSYCKPILVSSAAAATAADGGDRDLKALIVQLPDLRLDEDAKPRQVIALRDLRAAASGLRKRASGGMEATARIRAYAHTLLDADRRDALTRYADAMDAVLREQDGAGEELARSLVIAEGRRASYEANLQMAEAARPGSTTVVDDPGTFRGVLAAVAARFREHAAAATSAEARVEKLAAAVRC